MLFTMEKMKKKHSSISNKKYIISSHKILLIFNHNIYYIKFTITLFNFHKN